MDGVGISIIERPRPLHNHDTPNPTHHTYTLKCEEPEKSPLQQHAESYNPIDSILGLRVKKCVRNRGFSRIDL